MFGGFPGMGGMGGGMGAGFPTPEQQQQMQQQLMQVRKMKMGRREGGGFVILSPCLHYPFLPPSLLRTPR
jgi:hypothetical protein